MTGRSCSCDGSNANCSHCYGSGYLEDRTGKHSTPKRIPTIPHQEPPRPPARWDLMVKPRPEELAKFRHLHPKKNVSGKPLHPSRVNKHRELHRCNTCGILVRLKNVAQHSLTHTLTHNACSPKRQRYFSARFTVSCVTCGALLLNEGRLNRHYKRCHMGPRARRAAAKGAWGKAEKRTGVESRNAGLSNRRTQAIAARLDGWKEQVSERNLRDDPKLDCTRPYAHSYRENGRFGSHPSHDDFGDEGGA
jgi:hypothetical protein